MVDALIGGLVDARTDEERHSFGFADADEYAFWARRTCGLACLESYLTYQGIGFPGRASLVEEALGVGAYIREANGVKGLLYRPFLEWIDHRFGIKGTLMAGCDTDDVARDIQAGAMVICSVSSEIRNPLAPNARKGGHLVLVHGADDETLRFHNPSGFRANQENVCLDKATFARFFANRGMSLPTMKFATMPTA